MLGRHDLLCPAACLVGCRHSKGTYVAACGLRNAHAAVSVTELRGMWGGSLGGRHVWRAPVTAAADCCSVLWLWPSAAEHVPFGRLAGWNGECAQRVGGMRMIHQRWPCDLYSLIFFHGLRLLCGSASLCILLCALVKKMRHLRLLFLSVLLV